MSFWEKLERYATLYPENVPGLLMDPEDDDRFGCCRLVVTKAGYVMIEEEGKYYPLARAIMNAPKGMDVHHRNKNRLDNRKANLKFLTRSDHIKLHRAKTTTEARPKVRKNRFGLDWSIQLQEDEDEPHAIL